MKYFFMLFVCLTLSHFGYTQNDDRGYIVKVGDKAPDITITYTDGTRKKLSDFRGKIVMLQFTASWCGVCRKEMPFIEKDIWLKPGKQINNGAIVGGIGFVLYMAFSALGWSGIALIVAIGFGLESLYTFLSTLEWREKDKESVSYSIMWGTAALALLMLVPAVMTIKQALGL